MDSTTPDAPTGVSRPTRSALLGAGVLAWLRTPYLGCQAVLSLGGL